MRAIGLDIGTTTISAVVVDLEQGKAEKAYTIENGSFISAEESWGKIQDPEVIVQKAKELLDKILISYDHVQWIGLTGQMHGIVYTDKEGKHISPLYTWQDGSGDHPCFDGESVCTLMKKKYGMKVFTGYGLVTHLYHVWKDLVPEHAAKICTISDYLGMVLTGRKEPYMHSSNAASLGFFDVQNACFMVKRLEELEVSEKILPKVTDSYERIGSYQGIPVMTAIGDNQASFLGSVREPEKSILVNMGTGGQISVLSDQYCTGDGIETRPFNEGRYLIAGASLCGGRAYAMLENFFKMYTKAAGIQGIDHYGVMAELLKDEDLDDSAEELKITTTFSGTRENPDQRGEITNIGVNNLTPGAVISGVLHGMAEELYEMYSQIDKSVVENKTVMVASGNGIRKNVYLQRIMEKKFKMKLQIAENKEEAAYGAAMTGIKFTH